MKKNISINLFGTLYAIDEDAYNLLEKYLDSMKSYFSRQGESGLEIADDIEHRVAELLWQEKENGAEAVNIDMIKDIIGKIGDPAQIDDNGQNTQSEDNNNNSNTDNSNTRNEELNSHPFADGSSYNRSENVFDDFKAKMRGKRFYRDMSDKTIFGVCSGLSRYFGGDVTIWRIATVAGALLFWSMDIWWMPGIFSWMIPIGYLILGLVAPVAATPEDRLRMRGEDVTPNNINKEILNESSSTANNQYQQQPLNNGGCLKLLFSGCLIMILIPLILTLLGVIFAAPLFSGFMSSGLLSHIFGLGSADGQFITTMAQSLQGMFWALCLSLVITLVIPIIALFYLLSGAKKKVGVGIVIGLAVLWLASLCFSMYATSKAVSTIGKESIEYIDQWDDDLNDFETDTIFDEIDETMAEVDSVIAELGENIDSLNISIGNGGLNITTKTTTPSGDRRSRRARRRIHSI